jgi:hypothetical protein
MEASLMDRTDTKEFPTEDLLLAAQEKWRKSYGEVR